jgi:hypothetical protein
MRGNNVLDHLYTNIRDTYKTVPHPHFGQSDHVSLFLQKLKREPLTQRIVRAWTEEADSMLQECFENTDTDWNMFKDSSNQNSSINTDKYT